MANPRVGVTLGVDGAEASAKSVEQFAQRGAGAFDRLKVSAERAGTGADFVEGKLKRLNRGINDATGSVQLLSAVLPGIGGSFGALAGTIGNVADVFGTLSGILLRNPLGLAAVAATSAFVAYKAFSGGVDDTAETTKRFVSAIEAAEQAVTRLSAAADPNVAIINKLSAEIDAQRTKLEPLAAKFRELAEIQGRQARPIELSAEAQAKVTAAYEKSTRAGDELKQRLENLERSALDVKARTIATEITRMGGSMEKANLELTRGVSAMAQLQAAIDRVNFNKVKESLDDFALGGAGRAQRDFDQRKKQLDEFFGGGGNDAEYARLAKINRDKLKSDLDALQPKGGGGGRKTEEVDKLPEQYARLAASLDPVIARERELIDANRVLDEAQTRLGVSTETITDLKQRLADKAYAATDAGKADAAAVAEAQRLYDASITPMEQYEKQLVAIARALELNKINEEQANRARDAAKKGMEQANAESDAGKKTARDLGLAFSSAFEDAVVGGKKLRDVVSGLGQDLLRVFIRRQLTEPLLELFGTVSKNAGLFGGGSGGGGIFGDLFKGAGSFLGSLFGGGGGSQLPVGNISGLYANGAAFSGGAQIIPFASGGGIVNRPTMFPMRGGKIGLMGEAGEEAIMPLDRDASGKLGVRSRGGGGGGAPVIQISNTIDARGADKQLREQLPGILRRNSEQTIEQVSQLLDRGGAFSRKAGRRTL